MKLNKFLVAAASLTFAASAFANSGSGTIPFKGSIIVAPCSVDTAETEKEVNLGQIADSVLENGGKSHATPFKIVLKDCKNDVKKSVTATLSGLPSALDTNLLGMGGQAEGASIGITDSSGALVKLGVASAPQALVAGENTIQYNAYLQGDGKTPIKAGNFTASVTYGLTYQ